MVLEKGIDRQSAEDFKGSEKTLYDSIIMEICHYKFVQTHRTYNTRSKPQGKPWTLGDYYVSM